MSFLQRHPFPVVAHFDRVVALSFAFPEATLRPLVPRGLEIDSYQGLGFITVALVWTRDLRPAGLPRALGKSFFLAGFRIFTRLQDGDRRLRGLRILRSETDKQSMVVLGNLMTGYRYQRVDASIENQTDVTRVITRTRDGTTSLDLTLKLHQEDATLPAASPFPDWRTARRFAGPMPFTFSPQGDGSFVVIEGSREDWSPRPVSVEDWHVQMFQESPLAGVQPVLANAFTVEHIDYHWHKGRIVTPPSR